MSPQSIAEQGRGFGEYGGGPHLTWKTSLAHLRQRLCWQGRITTGLLNISRQMGQSSCFSRLSMGLPSRRMLGWKSILYGTSSEQPPLLPPAPLARLFITRSASRGAQKSAGRLGCPARRCHLSHGGDNRGARPAVNKPGTGCPRGPAARAGGHWGPVGGYKGKARSYGGFRVRNGQHRAGRVVCVEHLCLYP